MVTLLNVTFTKAQMVGLNAYVNASLLELGLDGQGGFEGCSTTVSPPLPGMNFRSGNPLFGFVANPQVNLWATFDGDFFTPGTPENGWGIEIGTTGGVAANNNCTGEFDIPGAITSWTNIASCYSVDWQGDLTSGTNLHFKINYFLQETDLFYTTTVEITNNTSATIPELFYYRNLDPDNNVSIGFDYTTQNTIVSQPGVGCNLAHVSATSIIPASQPQSYLGLAAVGPNWRSMYGGFSNRDGSNIWDGTGAGFVQAVGATNFADEAIALGYKIQNLAPGATEVLKFVVILDDASATQAINNLLYLIYPGSTFGTPSVCTPYIDTIQTCGGAVPISVTGPTVTDYTWSWSPATGLSSTTGSTVVANPATTTTYVVDGTPVSSCVAPISFTFVVEVTPGGGAAPVINAVPPICISNPPFNLTADSTGGNWSGTGITNTTAGTFNPATAGVGSFMITYFLPGMCFASDTVMVTVNNGPDPTITQPAPLCVGDTAITLTAATGGGTWSGTGITSGTGGTFNPSTAGVGSQVITYTVSGICSAVDTVIISVVGAFSAAITPPPTVCQGSPAFNFTAASPGGTWSGTGITNTSTGAYNPTTAGTFPIIYSIAGSCGDADTVNMIVVPQADATINPTSTVCTNALPFNLTAAGGGGLWSGVGIVSSFAGTFDPALSGGGTFTITYTIGGTCGDTDTETITVFAAPSPTFSSDYSSICAGQCINFFESVSTICANVIYDFGDGDSALVTAPNHCYDSAGIYSVTLNCIDANGCVGSITIPNMITVWEIPTANFTISPSSPIAPSTIVNFTDITVGGVSSLWNFDDPGSGSNTSSLTNATHSYGNEGDYCITLVATNGGGCIDTAKYCIVIVGEAIIFIPNVFSPNGDGNNDFFVVSSDNVREITYDIYDRWGLKIASYNGITGGWNGETKSGKMAADGVYYYVLKATADNGKEISQEGFFHLFSEK